MAADGRDIEEVSAARRANILGLRYLDTRTLNSRPLYEDLLEVGFMREYQVAPILSGDESVIFGITTMTPPQSLDELRHRYNDQKVRFVLISNAALEEYLKLYDPAPQTVYQDIELNADYQPEAIAKMSATLGNIKADDMLAYIVDQAFRLKVSDIHCETEKEKTQIRMRVHGVLHPVIELNQDQYRILISAVASAANISTAAKDAQTGHIGQTQTLEDGRKVIMNMRVETVPTINGMDIVMRFFSFDEENLQLDKLGFNRRQMAIVKDIIRYPRGLVLIAGPTGSGKTTTLYSMIRELRSPQMKIITLEDPVEYQITGVTQIPIDSHKGASFARGLRTVLRLDPDVVMLGEIRDEDSIQTALQAALSGHLVMSTYHASSTSLALISMIQYIHSNSLFLNAFRLIQAQRLMRRLDDKTKQAYTPSEAEWQQIKAIVDTIHPDLRPELKHDFKLYKPGVSAEHPFGYTRQIAIRELLVLDDKLHSYLLDPATKLNPHELEDFLCQQYHFTTLLQEGILRVIAGETTLEEVYKVGA